MNGFFRKARKIEVWSTSTRGITSFSEVNQQSNIDAIITVTSTMANTAQASSPSSVPLATPKANPFSNKEMMKAFYQDIIANHKSKKQINLANNWSGNTVKTLK